MSRKRRLLAATAAVTTAFVAIGAPARGVPTPVTATLKTHQYYVLSGHPDDPVADWAWLEQRPPTDYVVFASVTGSEGTLACVSAEDAQPGGTPDDLVGSSEPNQFAALLYGITEQPWPLPVGEVGSTGPYRYEGPNSPVGEPDKGERVYGYPWEGQGSRACARAQVAAWHWFLDEAHLIDGIGTTMQVDDPWADDDFRGRHCFEPSAKVQAQLPHRRQRQICADVWANAESARVAFDLPDVFSIVEDGKQSYSDLTFGEEAVAEALAFLRTNRATWGIPVLPEAGILAVGEYGGSPCNSRASSAHTPVLDVVRWHDLDIGEQAGALAACGEGVEDPYGQGDDVEHVSTIAMNPATLVAWNVVDPATGTRIGPVVKNFGWLLPNYAFDGSVGSTFWRRTG